MKYLQYNWKLSPTHPFVLSFQTFEKDDYYPILDIHHAIHINYVVSGSLYGRHGNQFLTLKQGDCILNPPWEIHGMNKISAGLQLYSITINTELLLKSFLFCSERIQNFFFMVPEERWILLQKTALRKKIGSLITDLYTMKQNDKDLLGMKQWFVIQQIFMAILENLPLQMNIECEISKLAPALKLLTQKGYIRISDAADACHLSESRFSHIFHKVYHISFKSYQMEQRLSRAAVNLKNGMSVKSAAASENFYDTSYFVKCFVKKFGITPGNFQ